jgi:hypothetical protein
MPAAAHGFAIPAEAFCQKVSPPEVKQPTKAGSQNLILHRVKYARARVGWPLSNETVLFQLPHILPEYFSA